MFATGYVKIVLIRKTKVKAIIHPLPPAPLEPRRVCLLTLLVSSKAAELQYFENMTDSRSF